ncbi:hypothetical protein ACS0TY_000187 [Phlomoides rotata]
MVYAALVSLAQTTDLILNLLKYSVSEFAKHRITSIHDFALKPIVSKLKSWMQPTKQKTFLNISCGITFSHAIR